MRIFVTGATGFIGQAVVKELLVNGHEVLGLARSDRGADILTSLGAEVHRGSLDDLDSLKRGASKSDGVIHLAFIHDFSQYEDSCHIDRLAIEAMGQTLAGSNRPLVVTSGTLLLPWGRMGKEDDDADLTAALVFRAKSEPLALSFASQEVRVSVVRLPPTNHGIGDQGFITQLVSIAREKHVSAFIADGMNRWPATHRFDTARIFRLALENSASCSTYHAVAEEGVTIKDIAEEIGKQLNIPVVSKSQEEASEHFGWLAHVLGADNPTSSAKTREKLNWKPTHPSLLQDLAENYIVT